MQLFADHRKVSSWVYLIYTHEPNLYNGWVGFVGVYQMDSRTHSAIMQLFAMWPLQLHHSKSTLDFFLFPPPHSKQQLLGHIHIRELTCTITIPRWFFFLFWLCLFFWLCFFFGPTKKKQLSEQTGIRELNCTKLLPKPFLFLRAPRTTRPMLTRHTPKKKKKCQKSHIYTHNSDVYTHKSPIYIHSKEPYIHSKEPYINSKEPCMHSKEPYIHFKEPYIHSKDPAYPQMSPIYTQKSPIYTQKSPTYP